MGLNSSFVFDPAPTPIGEARPIMQGGGRLKCEGARPRPIMNNLLFDPVSALAGLTWISLRAERGPEKWEPVFGQACATNERNEARSVAARARPPYPVA